jgi:hypothetical protein
MGLTGLLFLALTAAGCRSPKPRVVEGPRPRPAATSATMSVEEVIAMSEKGMPDHEIIDRMVQRRVSFRLTTADVLLLHEAHVSHRVIDAMLAGERSSPRVKMP